MVSHNEPKDIVRDFDTLEVEDVEAVSDGEVAALPADPFSHHQTDDWALLRKQWNVRYLVQQLVDRLSEADDSKGRTAWTKTELVLRIGTTCSGTDYIMKGIRALTAIISVRWGCCIEVP